MPQQHGGQAPGRGCTGADGWCAFVCLVVVVEGTAFATGLHAQETSTLWTRRSVQCVSGDFGYNFDEWKAWRDTHTDAQRV